MPEKYIRLVKVMYDRATVALRGGERLHSDIVSVNRAVLQEDILSPLCFITALHYIFSEPDAGVSLPNGIRLSKLEYADDISMVDQTAEEASSRITPLYQVAESKSGLVISVKNSYGQHVLKTNGIGRTTEEYIEAMNFKFICDDCSRSFPYRSSLATLQLLHGTRSKSNVQISARF